MSNLKSIEMSKKGRKIKKVEEPRTSREVDNTRGSHLWSYNHYRKRILTSLLNDLIDLENEGIEEETCNLIKRSLEYFINASTDVPSGGFMNSKPLYTEIEEFALIYKKWNDIEGSDPDKIALRKTHIRKLRDRRQKITNKVRKLQFELENNLDQQIMVDAYVAVGEMIRLFPNIFNNLTKSYGEYIKRGGAVA